jgi:tRNA(fMet)-specific endonuclease VapC
MLDTDMASHLIRGDRPAVTETFKKHFRNVCVSSVTLAELQCGAAKRRSQALTKKVQAFCKLVPCVDWGAEEAAAYANLRTDLEAEETPIGSMDMLIAASALVEGAILVTNNTAHFSRIRGLKLENWCET